MIYEKVTWSFPRTDQVYDCLNQYGMSYYQFCRNYGINYNSFRTFLNGKDIRYNTYHKIIAALDHLDENHLFNWEHPSLINIHKYATDNILSLNEVAAKEAGLTKRIKEDARNYSNIMLSSYEILIQYHNLVEQKRAKEFNMLEF